jgi:hypothetical protein
LSNGFDPTEEIQIIKPEILDPSRRLNACLFDPLLAYLCYLYSWNGCNRVGQLIPIDRNVGREELYDRSHSAKRIFCQILITYDQTFQPVATVNPLADELAPAARAVEGESLEFARGVRMAVAQVKLEVGYCRGRGSAILDKIGKAGAHDARQIPIMVFGKMHPASRAGKYAAAIERGVIELAIDEIRTEVFLEQPLDEVMATTRPAHSRNISDI